jgi:hypothetical protein
MRADATDQGWSLEEVVGLLDSQQVCLKQGKAQSKVDRWHTCICRRYCFHPRFSANHTSILAFDRRDMLSSLRLRSFNQTVEIQTDTLSAAALILERLGRRLQTAQQQFIVTPQDEKELYRLTDMLRDIDAQLQQESPLREGLKKAGVALSVAFIHDLRSEIEQFYIAPDSN